ncbi:CvfB family protein [Anaeromicropila herbilytica]|uniref:RNA-binding protein n=1 Tax=Anaeromicropila herbilytica TaxID=2785025 RepID=A0A7R7IBI4_9FIRM|nr:S1-like domain-containing RNA-binding protein [Anaeromicropila herbilytica]BCN29647.1 RNA-binding protein [Anaeromicropila herbilytica]
MIELGKIQTLEVIKTTDFGVYLSSDSKDKVLLPKNQVENGTKIGDKIKVFIYKDSEDRPIATAKMPALTLGELAVLKVIEVSSIGAFLDWGLTKDLLLPFKEQTERVHENDQILVSLYIDKSERLCATMKVYDYLETNSSYHPGDKVIGIVYEVLDEFGAFVAVDNQYSALVPNKELFRTLKPGDSIEARVTSVREDGKLNLSLREKVYVQMGSDASLILDSLKEHNGFLPYNDKTDPEIIKKEFGLSKNAFKRAIGKLFKEKEITILDDGIKLN